MTLVKKEFIADGMTCESCEKIISRQALKVDGVKSCKIDYSGQAGVVEFDEEKTGIDEILYKIEEKGYSCTILEREENALPDRNTKKLFGTAFGIIGIILIGYFIFSFAEGFSLPQITPSMGYGLLFVVGLLTGFHCIAMCGGFVVSYTAKNAQEGAKSNFSHLMYGVGKTLSYTIIGAGFGLLGAIIAFTPMMRGVAGILAGTFLLLFGLKMLNIFPILRKIQIRTPKFISRFVDTENKKHSSPLIIGLLNGLMIACGPLQAIYIMAAGTGSAIEGAKFLFVFGLGTLPVMLGFGYFASYVSSKMTHKILKASGAIVLVLGMIMINNGLTLTGMGYDVNSLVTGVYAANAPGGGDSENMASLKQGYQEIRMDVTRYGWEPNKFILKKDVPVRWVINGKEINGCNNAIQVPKLGLNFDIEPGEQTIQFTPDKEGVISWSCWMGMIPGVFIVKEDIDLSNPAEVQDELEKAEVPKGGSCGCGAG